MTREQPTPDRVLEGATIMTAAHLVEALASGASTVAF